MASLCSAPNLCEMVQTWARRRYPLLFSHRDDGEINGYEKKVGSGWVLYRKTSPYECRTMFPPR